MTESIGNALVNLGISCTTPFWKAQEILDRCYLPLLPGEYGQQEQCIAEIAYRIFSHIYAIPLGIASFPAAVLGHITVCIGNHLKKENYQYVSIRENPEGSVQKVFHLNACMLPGSLPMKFGGVLPASDRLEKLCNLILQEQSDLVLLSEINAAAADNIKEKLEADYSHFCLKIGMLPFGFESGLFIASKTPFAREFIPFLHQGSKLFKRGLFRMDFSDKVIFFTHLHSGESEEDKEIRKKQMQEVKEKMDQAPREKTCLLIGDLNIPMHDVSEYLDNVDHNALKLLDPSFSSVEETSTESLENYLKGVPSAENNQVLDYALCRRQDFASAEINLLETYQKPPQENFSYSLSDHKALIIRV